MVTFKPNQLAIFIKPKNDPEATFPMKDGESVLFLGEIPEMPGHCTVVTRTGRVFWPLGMENLQEQGKNATS